MEYHHSGGGVGIFGFRSKRREYIQFYALANNGVRDLTPQISLVAVPLGVLLPMENPSIAHFLSLSPRKSSSLIHLVAGPQYYPYQSCVCSLRCSLPLTIRSL